MLIGVGSREWEVGTRDWGLGTRDWGLGTGEWGGDLKTLGLRQMLCPLR